MIVNRKNNKVNQHVALITGGTSGFGTVLVRGFGESGYRTAYCGRSASDHRDETLISMRADVRSAQDMRMLCKTLIDCWGRIDVVIVNAGVNVDALLSRTSESDFDSIIETNLRGFFTVVTAALPYMHRQGYGHIIAVSSYTATAGSTGQSVYAASKAALTGAVKSAARESAAYGIRVNAVMPGFMDCGMGKNVPPEIKKVAEKQQLLGSLASAEESAAFVVHLAGMQQVSGQVFNIDSRVTGWI